MSELLRFLLQVIVIITVSRVAAFFLSRLRQPPVIGEIMAGIVLGPSVLGLAAPGVWSALFPAASLPLLSTVSQFGLILFMFLVGLRLDTGHIHTHRRSAAAISAASIVVPFAGGVALALVIRERLAPAGVSATAFAFFIGVAMSVTAFPVLARILSDTGLIATPLGTMAIACAAVDDVVAWILLAAGGAIARHGNQGNGLLRILFLLVAYAAIVLAARPVLARLAGKGSEVPELTYDRLAAVILTGVVSAAATEWIGIHALFGAFFVGLAMPKKPQFVAQVSRMLEPISAVVLLPIFFAYTGIRMTALPVEGRLWLDAVMIMLVAVCGKWGGAAIAARATGLSWRDASSLGILLNTRGLVELVILNVGLDLGVLSPALFSLMVLMTLVTTGMASPVLRMLQPGAASGNGI
jgi:Kef-type K+ transport system membrane component KefB